MDVVFVCLLLCSVMFVDGRREVFDEVVGFEERIRLLCGVISGGGGGGSEGRVRG